MEVDREVRLWNQRRLRELKQAHGAEIELFCAHDPSEFEALAANAAVTGTTTASAQRAMIARVCARRHSLINLGHRRPTPPPRLRRRPRRCRQRSIQSLVSFSWTPFCDRRRRSVRKSTRSSLLVLVEAREDDGLGAGHRVVMALQALRANLLHHALHRRVDRRDRPVLRAEIAAQRGAARLGDRGHHAVRADRDDPVDLAERDIDRSRASPAP